MRELIEALPIEADEIAPVSPIRLLESRTVFTSPAMDALNSEPESLTLDLTQAGVNPPSSEQTKIIGTIALFERFPPEPMTPEQAGQYFAYTGRHIRSNLIKRFREEVFVGAAFKPLRDELLLNGLLSTDALLLLAKYQAATSKKLPVFSAQGERIGVTKNSTSISFEIWADQVRTEYWGKATDTDSSKTAALTEYQKPIDYDAIAAAVAYEGEDGNYGASLLIQAVGRNEQALSEQLEVCIAEIVELNEDSAESLEQYQVHISDLKARDEAWRKLRNLRFQKMRLENQQDALQHRQILETEYDAILRGDVVVPKPQTATNSGKAP
jgi:hypothetical protein